MDGYYTGKSGYALVSNGIGKAVVKMTASRK